MKILVSNYITGSCRGYVPVARRGIESEVKPVPSTLNGLRGNERRAMQRFIADGATHYATSHYQGVPGKGYSNLYNYTIYTGYADK